MKVLKIEPDKCTGCQNCALACSLNKFGECNPHRAAIRVIKDPFERYEVPLVCVHCEEPVCLEICPQNAYTDSEGMICHDDSRCILCGMCAMFCPNLGINFTGDELIKCDLCGGDPVCVKYCSTNAIEYIEAEKLPVAARYKHVHRVMNSRKAEEVNFS